MNINKEHAKVNDMSFEEKSDSCESNNNPSSVEEGKKINRKKSEKKEIDFTEVTLTNWPSFRDQLSVRLATHTTPGCFITGVKIDHQIREGNRIRFSYKFLTSQMCGQLPRMIIIETLIKP